MCIPAARGVMEPLNEAQQECKQDRAQMEPGGGGGGGAGAGKVSLKPSALFSEQVGGQASGAGVWFGTPRLSHVEEACVGSAGPRV